MADQAGSGVPSPGSESWRRWGRFALAGLRIAASTIALVELLRSDWAGGVSASLAWLLFVQVERRWNRQLADGP
ncbi:MAG: hypothetical protein EVB08_09825 [Synechococcus sp. MED-G135]|nr:MAG: hypothetical protein EVB08_09825 [Synechococcus sp. MED-G135]